MVSDVGFRVQGLGFWVSGFGFRVYGVRSGFEGSCLRLIDFVYD